MELQSEAEDAARMEEWSRERMNTNLALHESFRDTNKDERERLQKAMRERNAQLQVLHKALEESAVKLGKFDECFAHIKHTTGVNSLKEMIMKISQHDTTHQRLVEEKKEAEDRLREAKLSLSNDQHSLDEMKTNGLGDIEWNRDVLDLILASIADEKAEVKIAKSANERLEELLVGIRQGSNGLFNRLLPFHSTLFLVEEAPKLGDIDLTNATQVASEVLEVIQFTENTLGKIL
jgi:chromosome segregation ATPase